MIRTAVQLYTLCDVDEPPWETVELVGGTSFDGVELYDAHFDALADEEALRRTTESLREADLDVAGAHVRVERLEHALDDVLEVCRALDCSRLVVPTYESDAFATRDGTVAAADHLARLATALPDQGVELLYHNHTFEFGDVGDVVAFEALVDRAGDRFGFQPDVGLAAHAGYDPLDLLTLVDDRAPTVHLTDTVPGDADRLHADVGEGVVDAAACATRAAEHGAEWIVCENGSTDDGVGSLAHGSTAFAELRRIVAESASEP